MFALTREIIDDEGTSQANVLAVSENLRLLFEKAEDDVHEINMRVQLEFRNQEMSDGEIIYVAEPDMRGGDDYLYSVEPVEVLS